MQKLSVNVMRRFQIEVKAEINEAFNLASINADKLSALPISFPELSPYKVVKLVEIPELTSLIISNPKVFECLRT